MWWRGMECERGLKRTGNCAIYSRRSSWLVGCLLPRWLVGVGRLVGRLVGVGWSVLVLVGVGRCWSVLAGVGRCWLVLAGVGWCWRSSWPPFQRPALSGCLQGNVLIPGSAGSLEGTLILPAPFSLPLPALCTWLTIAADIAPPSVVLLPFVNPMATAFCTSICPPLCLLSIHGN